MSPQPPSMIPSDLGIKSSLHTIAEILRDPHPLSHEIRTVLADLLDEVGRMLATATVPPSEVAHLADSTALLARAVHR